MTEVPSAQRWARRVTFVIAGVLYGMVAIWILEDPATNLQTDWTSFDNAADRLFEGEAVYQRWDPVDEPLPFLYPPFVLILTLPLRLFGFFASWGYSAVFTGATYAAGLALALRSTPGPSVDRRTAFLIALGSGSMFGAGLIGQYSGMYVLAFGLAIWCWHNDRRFLAGLALSILIMKPNIAIAVPFVLIWSRSWRQLQGFVVGSAAALLLSLPFGLHQWSEFVANVQDMGSRQLTGQNPDDKMVTIVGNFITWTGGSAASFSALAVWASTAAILGLAVLAVWTRPQLEASPQRAFAIFAIFVVVANPRMWFYDAILIAMATTMLWVDRESLGGLARRVITPASVILWVLSWGGAFSELNRFVGVAGAALLLVVVADSVKQAKQRTENSGDVIAILPSEASSDPGVAAA